MVVLRNETSLQKYSPELDTICLQLCLPLSTHSLIWRVLLIFPSHNLSNTVKIEFYFYSAGDRGEVSLVFPCLPPSLPPKLSIYNSRKIPWKLPSFWTLLNLSHLATDGLSNPSSPRWNRLLNWWSTEISPICLQEAL